MRKDSQILLFYQNAEIKRSKEYVNIFLFLYNFYTMGGICQFQIPTVHTRKYIEGIS